MRVSDTDRERTVEELRRHCAAGRLDVDEYGLRVEQALAATTLADLDRVLGDLPMVRIADPSGRLVGSAGRALDHLEAGIGGPLTARFGATLVVLLSVMVVLAAVALIAVVSWTWGLVLLAGWVVGLAQGRLVRGHR